MNLHQSVVHNTRRAVRQSASLLLALLMVPSLARAAAPTTRECLAAAERSTELRPQHRLQAARAELLVCAESSCPGDVRSECLRRIEAINASMPSVVFEVKDSDGNDIAGVTLTMDGQPLYRSEGVAIPIDPGEHHFAFDTSAGRAEKTLVIREAEKHRLERIVIAAPVHALVPPLASTAGTGPRASGEGSSRATRTQASVVLGALGVAGLTAGAVLGMIAKSKSNSGEAACPSATDCPHHDEAVRDHDSAVSAATFSTISFLAGGALATAGVVFYLTVPHAEAARWRIEPTVSASAGGLLLKTTL